MATWLFAATSFCSGCGCGCGLGLSTAMITLKLLRVGGVTNYRGPIETTVSYGLIYYFFYKPFSMTKY